MKTLVVRLGSLLGIVLVLGVMLLAFVRFYPYTYSFPELPRVTRTHALAAGDPLNVFFVGSREQITHSFHLAGWLIPDSITPQTSARIAADSLAHRSYPTAPVSNLYVFGRVQDLAFEKPTSDVQKRGHIRIWETNERINEQPIWVGAASYDNGIELSRTTLLPTHHIAPAIDLERNAVGADLEHTGLVTEETEAAFTPPLLFARNGGGDAYASDGDILLINYTRTSLPLAPPAWGIEGLKNGVFLCYTMLFTVPGALMTCLGLVAVLGIGLLLWQGRAKSRTRRRQNTLKSGQQPQDGS